MLSLTLNTLKNNKQDVLDLLDKEFFIDHTLTLADEDYLKRTIKAFLLQIIFVTEGIVSINKDPKDVISTMYRESLSPDKVGFILDSSLSINKNITISSSQARTRTKEELDGLKLQEDSISNMIESVSEFTGSPRTGFGTPPNEEEEGFLSGLTNMFSFGSSKGEKMFIQKPMEMNLCSLNLIGNKKIKAEDYLALIESSMAMDSNCNLTLLISEKFVPPVVLEISKLIDDTIVEDAIDMARNSNKNNSFFVVKEDPFQTLYKDL